MQDRKIVLVTGASSGMGKATALRLIEDGHIVYGGARRTEKLQELTANGGHAQYLDVTKVATVTAVIDQIIAAHGRIDVLVNNAGYALYGAVEVTRMEDARRQFEVNFFGLAEITRRIIPIMRAQQSGRIINLSSMGGKIYTPLGAWYHATKHALEGWSDCLRLELKQFNIDVVIIEPGIIATEFGDVLTQPLLEGSENTPYERMAQQVADTTVETYEKGKASSPEMIASLISRAIMSKHPKTRYAKGHMAKPLMLIRKYLGDRIFDKVVMQKM